MKIKFPAINVDLEKLKDIIDLKKIKNIEEMTVDKNCVNFGIGNSIIFAIGENEINKEAIIKKLENEIKETQNKKNWLIEIYNSIKENEK